MTFCQSLIFSSLSTSAVEHGAQRGKSLRLKVSQKECQFFYLFILLFFILITIFPKQHILVWKNTTLVNIKLLQGIVCLVWWYWWAERIGPLGVESSFGPSTLQKMVEAFLLRPVVQNWNQNVCFSAIFGVIGCALGTFKMDVRSAHPPNTWIGWDTVELHSGPK